MFGGWLCSSLLIGWRWLKNSREGGRRVSFMLDEESSALAFLSWEVMFQDDWEHPLNGIINYSAAH